MWVASEALRWGWVRFLSVGRAGDRKRILQFSATQSALLHRCRTHDPCTLVGCMDAASIHTCCEPRARGVGLSEGVDSGREAIKPHRSHHTELQLDGQQLEGESRGWHIIAITSIREVQLNLKLFIENKILAP